jgi:hypothetical protein
MNAKCAAALSPSENQIPIIQSMAERDVIRSQQMEQLGAAGDWCLKL